jgi:hypothetical protein
MKKYLIWIGAAILVMALASPSMAQFKSWGHLEVFSYWEVNKSFNKDLNDANYQGIGMRYRFNLGYGDPKTVMAVLGFEANSRGFGENPEAGARIYGSGPTAAGTSASTQPIAGQASAISSAGAGATGAWGTDVIGLQVRHAYLDFTIPNTPLTMQIGMQAQSIGGFLGRFFMLKDVPAFVLNGNFAPHTISAFWWKGVKSNYYMDNDLDYYGVRYQLKQQVFNIEAWGVYGNDRRTVTDAWSFTRTAGTAANSFFYTPTETLTPRPYEQKPWWLGANVPITFGNWKFEPTFIYLGGKAIDSPAAGSGLTGRDFSAYLGDLMVSYRLGPGLKFLFEGFYASGNDGQKNPALTTPGATDTVTAWQTPSPSPDGSENRNVFGQFWSVFYFYNTDFGYYSGHQLSPSGHMFARGNVEFNPLAWLNLNFNYLYIQNSANKYVAHISGNGGNVDKNFIGQELNVIAKIALYKDFVYTIGYGYFFPGDVFDTPTKTADQAWNLLTNLKYAF